MSSQFATCLENLPPRCRVTYGPRAPRRVQTGLQITMLALGRARWAKPLGHQAHDDHAGLRICGFSLSPLRLHFPCAAGTVGICRRRMNLKLLQLVIPHCPSGATSHSWASKRPLSNAVWCANAAGELEQWARCWLTLSLAPRARALWVCRPFCRAAHAEDWRNRSKRQHV